MQSINRGCKSSQTTHCSVQTCAWCAEFRNRHHSSLERRLREDNRLCMFDYIEHFWNISHKTIKQVLFHWNTTNYKSYGYVLRRGKSGCLSVIKQAGLVWVILNVKWCPVWRITTPLARKRSVLWVKMKRRFVRAARKTSKWPLFINSRRLYLNYCSNGVKPYTINLIKDRWENAANQMSVSMRVRYSGVND